jgi:hypothetical protein
LFFKKLNNFQVSISVLTFRGITQVLKNSTESNFSRFILAFIVSTSMGGLLGFAMIDPNARNVFLEVAKISIAAFLGYLIPNGK